MEKRQRPGYNRSEVLPMTAKKTIQRMLAMCPDAWYIFLSSVKLTAFVLLCAFVLLLGWGGRMAEGGYRLYMTAMSLYETGQALLLVGALFSALIEDAQSSRR